jgi:Zn-dependent peptidase ImmA (M78 family)
METVAPRYDYARDVARRLFERSGITIPPVDLYLIIEMCGLRYEEVDYFPEDVDALIIVTKEGAVAVINKNQQEKRRRFSLAHELYHYLEEGGGSVLEDVQDTRQQKIPKITKAGKDPFEVEADAFAGELLIPKALIRKYVRPNDSVDHVARLFDVSEAVAAIRIGD